VFKSERFINIVTSGMSDYWICQLNAIAFEICQNLERHVPQDVNITGEVEYLDDDTAAWVEKIQK